MSNFIVDEESNKSDEAISSFIDTYKNSFVKNENVIEINAESILEFSPTLFESLINNPLSIMPIIQEKLKVLHENAKIHIFNLNNKIEIGKIRTIHLGKLCSLKGTIKRITKIVPRTKNIKYECPSCGAVISVLQSKKQKQEPSRCSCGRKSKFKIILEDIKDIQEINLEEAPEELEGRQPQQIRIYVEDELTDKTLSTRLQPGKKVEIIGIIEKLPAFMNQKDEELNLSEFMVFAKNIINLEEEDETQTSEEDVKIIREIASNNPLEKLSENLAPEVYGNEVIKKALVLQMAKGVPRERSDGSLSREDIHVLLCGDVGIAKSVILKSVQTKTPKSKMLIGTRTSRVGLGAMCVKDELLGVWSLEAGALVLANNSTICLDEIDKIPKEHLSELLEPMSSGTVSVNRAGISAVLPARTSILASANPIYGNYDTEQPLPKQIDLPSPILNRFDLVFVLIDKPNAEFDSASVEHVFNNYIEPRTCDISTAMFKKYISFCRKIKPKLNENLIESIKNFYVNLRQCSNKDGQKGLPINLRNMEGIIKLAEAHAKLRLSEKVEIEDLKVAKDIFMFCLKQIGIDNETGLVDTSRIINKVPVSKRKNVETLLNIVDCLREKFENKIPYEDILNEIEAQQKDIKNWEVYDFLEQLKQTGKIFEPTKGVYSLL